MKRILDADFRYRPSFATNVRETFEKARREQREAQDRETQTRHESELRIVKLEHQRR